MNYETWTTKVQNECFSDDAATHYANFDRIFFFSGLVGMTKRGKKDSNL